MPISRVFCTVTVIRVFMIPNAAIKNLIREDKLHQIYSQMQMGQAGSGMQTMAQSLVSLYQRRLITLEEAFTAAADPEELRAMLEPRAASAKVAPGAHGITPPVSAS